MQPLGAGGRDVLQEAREELGGRIQLGVGGEAPNPRAGTAGKAGLGPREGLGEAPRVGAVGPGPRLVAAAAADGGEAQQAPQERLPGHGLHLAEVGLGGGVEGGDDLGAPRLYGLVVARDLVEEAPAAGRGVVEVVDVGVELALPRGHAPGLGAGEDQAIGPRGLDQGALHLGRGRGLGAGHGQGTEEDGVHRHGR